MTETEDISVFDLDGTLWKKNSHLVLLNAYFNSNFYTSFFARIFSRLFPTLWQNNIDKKFDEIPQSFILEFDIKELELNPKIISLLEEKRKTSKILLISNAPEKIVQRASLYFNAEGIHADIGKKSETLEKYKYRNLFVCTDNKSDSDLLEIASDKLFIQKEFPSACFYIPMIYSFKTRYKGLASFFITSILPLLVYFNVFVSHINKGRNFISLLFSYLITNLIYEIGYILNDVYPSAKEKNPTNRLMGSELSFCKDKIVSIISVRVVYITLLFILLVTMRVAVILFLIASFSLMVCYVVHNNISPKYRFITNFILVSLRYISPFSIYRIEENTAAIIQLFLTVPFLKTNTYILKKNFKASEKFLDTFQLIYYCLLTCFFIISSNFFGGELFCLLLSLFLFLYRFFIKIFRAVKSKDFGDKK